MTKYIFSVVTLIMLTCSTALAAAATPTSSPSCNASNFAGNDIGAKINAAVATIGPTGGGIIIVPANQGRVRTTIVINYPHITLQGVGKNVTVLKASDTFVGTDMILVSSASDVTVQDMEIDGNQSVLHSTNLYGVHYLNAPNGRVSGCNVHNLVTAGVGFYSSSNSAAVLNDISDVSGYVGSTGVVASNSTNVKVLYNNINRCNGAAARAAGSSDDGNGIYFSVGANNGLAVGNTIVDCGRRGVKIQASGVTVANNPRIEDCAQSCVQVQLEGLSTPISSVKILNNTCVMTLYGTYGVVLEEWLRNADVIGNSFTGALYTGVDVRQGIDGANITNNTFDGNAGWAIRLENQLASTHPSNNIKVHFNTITNCGVTNAKPSIEARTGVAPLTNLSFIGNNVGGNGALYAYLIGNNQDGVQFFNNIGAPVSVWGAVTNLTTLPGPASATSSGYLLSTTQSIGGAKTIVGNADEVQLTVKGNGTQTTHLQDWKDGAGNVKATIQWTGNLGLGGQDAPTVALHAGVGTSTPIGDGTGTNFSPQIQATPVSGVAGLGAFVNDGVHNRRIAMFVDEPNALLGISTSYASGGETPFVIRTASGEKVRISSTAMQVAVGGSANKSVCWKSDGKTLGYCSSLQAADGSCTCN